MLSLFFLFSKFTFRLVSMFEICHKSIKVKKNFFYFFNIHVFCHEITQHKSKHFFLSKTRRSIARIFCLLPIANGIKFHHDKKFFLKSHELSFRLLSPEKMSPMQLFVKYTNIFSNHGSGLICAVIPNT